jgi:hypothetical protein
MAAAPVNCWRLLVPACYPALAMPHAMCVLVLSLRAALQYGQSHFFKLPGGKLKPDEDGECHSR